VEIHVFRVQKIAMLVLDAPVENQWN